MSKINKNVVMLGLVSYFTDFASAMITPILPIFVVTVLHEGMDKLGLIVAVATFISYGLRVVSGYIADRFGLVKPLVVGGYVLSAISKPLFGFAHDYISVGLLRSAERFGKGVRAAPKDLLISHYTHKDNSGKTFGFHKTLDLAGELSGALFLFLMLYWFGQSESVIRNVFFATFIPGAIGVFIVLFVVKDIDKSQETKQNLSLKLTQNDKRTISQLLFYFLFAMFALDSAYFAMQAKSIGISTLIIPLLFIVSTTAQSFTSYYFGLLSDKIGVKKVMGFSYVSGVLAQFFLYLQTPIFTWIAYGFLGLFTVISLNANRALIAKNADNRGVVFGIFYACVALFGAVGAYVFGLVWQHYGMSLALTLSFASTIIITLLFFVRGNFR
ncbi:MFS transporter [bacterium]|nr:MFS transporter [bacterium]MBU1882805.1 MFS transporter [bacterium]